MEVNPVTRFFRRDKRSHPEFLADSAEQIAHSIDMTGLRGKIDRAVQTAIARARWCSQRSCQAAINETRKVDSWDDATLK